MNRSFLWALILLQWDIVIIVKLLNQCYHCESTMDEISDLEVIFLHYHENSSQQIMRGSYLQRLSSQTSNSKYHFSFLSLVSQCHKKPSSNFGNRKGKGTINNSTFQSFKKTEYLTHTIKQNQSKTKFLGMYKSLKV